MDKLSSHYFTASDGAQLHYLKVGTGETLLMLPGAGLSAEIFMNQIQAFGDDFQVISLDKRGHGRSEKVDFGYCVSRFTKDLYDLLLTLDLDDVTLLCHSLGASMAYNYFDLFGTQRIKKLIVVDEPAALLINPIWSEREKQQYGSIYEASTLHELTNNFTGANVLSFNKETVDMMTSKHATDEQKKFILQCMEIPGAAAAKLYNNNICQDFRDVLRKIDIPTLFIAGKASLLPWQSHRWMHEQVPHSKLAVFEENEGGSHFMFVENPEKFNQVVLDFVKNRKK